MDLVQTKKRPLTLLDLPNENLDAIFGFSEYQAALKSLMLVNRRISSVAEHVLWRRPYLVSHRFKRFLAAIKRNPDLAKEMQGMQLQIRTDEWPAKFLAQVGAALPTGSALKSISFRPCEDEPKLWEVTQSLRPLPALRSVKIRNALYYVISSSLSTFPTVRSLTVEAWCMNGSVADLLRNLFSVFPELRSLTFTDPDVGRTSGSDSNDRLVLPASLEFLDLEMMYWDTKLCRAISDALSRDIK